MDAPPAARYQRDPVAFQLAVELGLLCPSRPGHYREPHRCRLCGSTLTGRQQLYCSRKCANDTHNGRIAAERTARRCEYVAKGQ